MEKLLEQPLAKPLDKPLNKLDELVVHYQRAALKMADLPVYNPVLTVATVGFQDWTGRQIGVLITPWFMNLICFANADDPWYRWGEQQIGHKQMLSLPSGQYECLYSWAEGAEGYLSCSLFSPMAEFEQQSVALETAEAVMAALFDAEHIALTDRQRAMQQAQQEQVAEQVASEKQTATAQSESEGLSRRRFMTAGLSTERHDQPGSE
ncbi:MAG: [NiFe]-hydrogenase assembly chaperone HybE [Amphritea sp.]|nr:[NiFe]-hydrogenase assembly chaperone HybE [Amphritea sp.]